MSQRTIFDQSESRIQDVPWRLIGRKSFHCAMYLLPLDLVSKNLLLTNQNLFKACSNSGNDRWTCIIPFDMYRLAWCKVWFVVRTICKWLRCYIISADNTDGLWSCYMSHVMRKPVYAIMPSTKVQISLCIHAAVLSTPLLFAAWTV